MSNDGKENVLGFMAITPNCFALDKERYERKDMQDKYGGKNEFPLIVEAIQEDPDQARIFIASLDRNGDALDRFDACGFVTLVALWNTAESGAHELSECLTIYKNGRVVEGLVANLGNSAQLLFLKP